MQKERVYLMVTNTELGRSTIVNTYTGFPFSMAEREAFRQQKELAKTKVPNLVYWVKYVSE